MVVAADAQGFHMYRDSFAHSEDVASFGKGASNSVIHFNRRGKWRLLSLVQRGDVNAFLNFLEFSSLSVREAIRLELWFKLATGDCARLAVPLEVAAECGNFQMVDFLLKSGANPNRLDSQGRTSLFYAVRGGRTDVVKCLIAAGASRLSGRPDFDEGDGCPDCIGLSPDDLAPDIVALLDEHGISLEESQQCTTTEH